MSQDNLETCLAKKPQELRMLHFLKSVAFQYDTIARSFDMSYNDRENLRISDSSSYHRLHKVINFYINSGNEQTWSYVIKCLRKSEFNAKAREVMNKIQKEDLDDLIPTCTSTKISPDGFWLTLPVFYEIWDMLKNRSSELHSISVMFGFNLMEFEAIVSDYKNESADYKLGAIISKWLNERHEPTWFSLHSLACSLCSGKIVCRSDQRIRDREEHRTNDMLNIIQTLCLCCFCYFFKLTLQHPKTIVK